MIVDLVGWCGMRVGRCWEVRGSNCVCFEGGFLLREESGEGELDYLYEDEKLKDECGVRGEQKLMGGT